MISISKRRLIKCCIGVIYEMAPNNNPRNIDKIREHVGMVFQQFNLFPHMTVLENITMAPVLIKGINKEDAKEDTPAMMSFAEVCLKRGFVFKNVKNINLKNVKLEGFVGKQIDIEGNNNYHYE